MSLNTTGVDHSELNGVLVAVAVDQPTFYYSVKFKSGKNASQVHELESGINVETFRYLRDAMNLTEKAIKSRGQMNENENGEVINEGIVAVLNSGVADIAISLYELLPYRMAGPYGVRFIHAVFKSSQSVAVFTQPPKASARNVYGRPFQTNVWRFVFGSPIFVAITMIILFSVKLKLESRLNRIFSICNNIKIFILCIFTRQSCFEDLNAVYPTSVLSRLSLIVLLLSSVVLQSIFSSALTSILAVDVYQISSFKQLIGKRYTLYYDKYVPSIENILEEVVVDKKRVTVVEMGKSIENIMKKAAPKIFASKAALLTTSDRYYPYFKKHYHDGFLCSKLTTIPLPSESAKSSNFVKQGSPLRDLFNIKLLLMQQTGLIDRLYTEHNIKTRLTCFASPDSKLNNLDLLDTAFPFIVLSGIASLAIVVFSIEVTIQKIQQKSLKYLS